MELKLLFVEDDQQLGQNLITYFNGLELSSYLIKAEIINNFDEAISHVSKSDFDLVILDLFKDEPDGDKEAGIRVLDTIRQTAFVPVIFYTGHAHKIQNLVSEIVGVVSKGDGIEALTNEIERIITSKIALIKSLAYNHLKESLRKYFWETVDTQKGVFKPGHVDVSLGYLWLRRFASSLSKENIKELLGDERIKPDKAHPMEFYVYPINPEPDVEEYQTGEILKKDDNYYAILTPDCDFVMRPNGSRKADKILLATTKKFKGLPDYVKYTALTNKQDRSKEENNQLSNLKGKLINWISNQGGEKDRFFFLPFTPFIENLIIDFQVKEMVDYAQLKSFTRVAKLDLPYAQSMIASFIRYYNRIGFPDIDSDYVIDNL